MDAQRKMNRWVWIPFVCGVGTISWVILPIALAILATVILAPAANGLRTAEKQRNDMRASLRLLDEKIALQARFVQAAGHNPLLMERLASRQLNIERPDQQILSLGNGATRDRTVQSLIAQSLPQVKPAAVPAIPWWMAATLNAGLRPLLLMLALTGLLLSYVLGVRVEKRNPAVAQ